MAPKKISSLPHPTKKRKTNSGKAENVTTLSVKSIADLEKHVAEALQSNASLNPLADLVYAAISSPRVDDTELCLKAVFACYRSFVLVIQKGLLDQSYRNRENEADEPSAGVAGDADRKAVRSWVSGKLDTFVEFLCGLLRSEDKTLRTSALKILFSILRQQSNRIGLTSDPSSSSSTNEKPLRFDVPFFKKIVEALLVGCSSSKTKAGEEKLLEADIRDQLLGSWLNVYGDVRWFFLRETTAILNNKNLIENNSKIILNALAILEKLANFPTEENFSEQQFWIEELGAKPVKKGKKGKLQEQDDEDSGDENQGGNELDPNDWRTFFEEPKENVTKGRQAHQRIHKMSIHEQLHSLPAHRAVFTKCWLTLLPLLSKSSSGESENGAEETLALVTRVLNILHVGVLPHLTRAILIMDWVSACVDFGGNVGLLALNALFTLMRDYNLDYPQFYTRLYTFLDRTVLHLKHRSRFFRLTELFLSSSHLPATLLASFVKRLSRLSLSAPPAAIIMIIPFTYNILKRHPALMVMIHRTSDHEDDPFDYKETDPTLTKALQSSLWELYSQKRHYHSVVSTMSKIFEEAFTKPNYAMEDFLDHTYATLFDSDINRKIKKEPAVLDLVVSNAESTEDVMSLWQLS